MNMARAILTPAAVRDLVEIRTYFSAQSPTAAERVTAALERSVDLIARRPSLGHRRRDLTLKDVWFYRVFTYFVVYRRTGQACEIIRVVHAARDIADLLDD